MGGGGISSRRPGAKTCPTLISLHSAGTSMATVCPFESNRIMGLRHRGKSAEISAVIVRLLLEAATFSRSYNSRQRYACNTRGSGLDSCDCLSLPSRSNSGVVLRRSASQPAGLTTPVPASLSLCHGGCWISTATVRRTAAAAAVAASRQHGPCQPVKSNVGRLRPKPSNVDRVSLR